MTAVKGHDESRKYTVDMSGEVKEFSPEYVRHVDTIRLTKWAYDAARVRAKLYGAGLSGQPPEENVEYHV